MLKNIIYRLQISERRAKMQAVVKRLEPYKVETLKTTFAYVDNFSIHFVSKISKVIVLKLVTHNNVQ